MHFPLKIGIHDTEANCFEIAATMVRSVRPDLIDPLEYQFFTEGFTNRVMSIWSTQKGSNDRVLVRIFGEKTELMIDRDAELNNLLKLNSVGCGAKVYGTFENGLVYEYIPGEALDCEQVGDEHFYRLIARNLAKLHKRVPLVQKEMSSRPFFVHKTESFLKELKEFSFDDPDKQKVFKQNFSDYNTLCQQFQQLVDGISKLQSPLVFCHNDLLPKNIVYDSVSDRISFIDFEYADFNWQAYDIADHFCEFAGMDDFDPTRYPSKTVQLNWLAEYLTTFKQLSGDEQKPTKDEVENLYIAVNKCAAATDFFWGIWGIIQAKLSSIDFDYLQFAAQRLDQFKQRSPFTFA